MTFQDLDRIAALPEVDQVVPVRSFTLEARRMDRLVNAQLQATTPAYAELNRLDLANGRFLIDADNEYFRNVVVIGPKVADALFPGDGALGETILMPKSLYVDGWRSE